MKLINYFLFLSGVFSSILSLLFLCVNMIFLLLHWIKTGIFSIERYVFFDAFLLGTSFGVFISLVICIGQYINNNKNRL
ncbi:hypothetical protein J2067_001127 [Erwinia rhapontici]|nr:hypothetical protein [Erwinia rhapontici]